jgi:3-hydroxyacyl-CoA dehydrogenase/enoyl-CoA hydratase/3-hydroxybutyryl-CoA epimerase
MTVWMDAPGKPVNTCSSKLLDELDAVLGEIERERPAAVIIASGKPRSFNAGADLTEIRKMGRNELVGYLVRGQALFERLARLPMTTVAAINGDCLGGGFELALACTRRVAADDPAISIGPPEVKLGLIPAWGGTTRLPQLIGPRRALPVLLAGKTMPPRKAQKSGLVDEVVRPEALLAAAGRLARKPAGRARSVGFADRAIARVGPLRRRALEVARQTTLQRTMGNYPAPLRLLDVVAAGLEKGHDAGLKAEREAILGLMDDPVCQNLLRIFFLRQGAKKRLARQLPSPPHDVQYAAVIGGGTMGSGIVHALIRARVQVRLVEVSTAAVSAALGRVRAMLDQDVADGRLDKLGARHAMNHVSPTTDWTGLRVADVAVEAAFEDLDAKREVFARLETLCRPDAVLATNTSSLRVGEIARAVSDPGRVVGLHFFNPVPKMPLVEVVRAEQSTGEALATAAALAGRLGKTPILVADAPGFLVNRLLIPYLSEAIGMAGEGTSVALIDRAMKRWGMPMGPFELLDEIGLDVAASVLKSLTPTGGPGAELPRAINVAIDRRWLGKKTGHGFYLHDTGANGRRGTAEPAEVSAEVSEMLHGAAAMPAPAVVPPETEQAIQWRLVLPMVNQAASALREGVVDSAETIDLPTILGAGLAPFRGGLTHFADTVGISEIVRRMEDLAARYGPRFAPDPLLREMVAAGQTFEQWSPPIGATAPAAASEPAQPIGAMSS